MAYIVFKFSTFLSETFGCRERDGERERERWREREIENKENKNVVLI